MKKNNNYNLIILVKKFSISTKKPVLSTPTNTGFFWFHFGLFLENSLRLDVQILEKFDYNLTTMVQKGG
jgi:hypothetical protein